MKGIKGYVAIGILSYVIALACTIPAKLAVDHVLPRVAALDGLVFTKVKGTVFDGSVEVSAAGRNWGRWNWQLRLLSVLLGSLDSDLEWRDKDNRVDAVVGVGFGSTISISDAKGHVSVSELRTLLPANIRRWIKGGELQVQIDQAELADDRLQRLDGLLIWKEPEINSLEHLDIGDLSLNCSTDEKGTTKGIIEDKGGMLRAQGELTLDANGRYRGSVALADRSGSGKSLGPVFSMLGRKDRNGVFRISLEGALY